MDQHVCLGSGDSVARFGDEAAATRRSGVSAGGADVSSDVIVQAVPVLLRVPEAPGALWDDALAVADAVLSKVKKEPVSR